MLYTIRNMCEEMPSLPYEDGARTLFLYTKGTQGNLPEELQKLLHYMEHTTEENAITESLKRIHQMVYIVKQDREVSINFMKTLEWEEMLISQGQKQGLIQGQKMERANTEREKLRADQEAERANRAEKDLMLLKKKLAVMEAKFL